MAPSVFANGGIRGIRGYYPTTDTTETGFAGHGVVYEFCFDVIFDGRLAAFYTL